MFKRTLLIFALLTMTTVMTGCFHQQIIYDGEYDASKIVPDYQQVYFHVIGLIGIENEVDLSKVCPGGTGLVETKTFFALGFPIFWLNAHDVFSVRQMSVYCS